MKAEHAFGDGHYRMNP